MSLSNEAISLEELTKKRTPSELMNWVEQKAKQIESTEDGEKALRLRKGLAKQLMEEVYPLALFAQRKYDNNDHIILQPIIGNQSYDAVVTDLRSTPTSQSYIEITQSHEGESDYLRSLDLQNRGFTFGHGTIIKKGTKKTGLQVSVKPIAKNYDEFASDELKRIVDAAKKKAAKNYPINTSLLIIFGDDWIFRQAIDNVTLDAFVKQYILNLDLRFSTLYLVGWHNVFREFSIDKKI